MNLEGDSELSFCKEYISTMFKLLRSETPDCAWKNLRALQELEEFVDKKIYLELTVKVNKDWRNNEKQLKRFGYEL